MDRPDDAGVSGLTAADPDPWAWSQHYLLDVVAGILLAAAARFVFLRGRSPSAVADEARRSAPVVSAVTVAGVGALVGVSWVAYLVTR